MIIGKLIRKLTLGALAAGMTPYRIQYDKETKGFELNSLLWAVKKTPGEERDKYTIELLPLFGKKEEAPEEAAE